MYVFLIFAVLLILLLFALGMIVYIIFFSVIPMVRGAFYAPTNKEALETMVRLARVEQGEKAIDIGSGDGRIVIALAKAGAIAHGYEINPLLVWWSRFKIRRAGLGNRAFIFWGDFWHQKFGSFDIVTVYGITYIMKGLEKKLRRELKPGTRVISHGFQFPTWQCSEQSLRVYLYKQN